jgi:uncharacterized protein (TIGR00269 family)
MAKCTSCKSRDSIFIRPYSGEKMCGRCFKKSIEKKVQTTISKYDMLKRDDMLAVAVSGGKDSISLLYILTKIEKNFPQARLCAVTVDEGLRGYRDEAMKFAMKSCQKLGVKHSVVSFKEMFGYSLDELVNMIQRKGEKDLTPCSYCGVLRRRALNSVTREADANKLATAHNLDDETQTILLNIIHGDATRISRVKPVLSVVHPKLVQRIKPFCEVPEREIALYAYLKKIQFQENPCPYAQTALRNDIRTMLNRMEQKHAGTKFTIFRSMERIRPALEAMGEEEELHDCKLCGEPTLGEVCRPCQMLQKLHIL